MTMPRSLDDLTSENRLQAEKYMRRTGVDERSAAWLFSPCTAEDWGSLVCGGVTWCEECFHGTCAKRTKKGVRR
jgi:hypothetical protein